VGAVTWIEVLDRRDRVMERVRVASLPMTIGRDYSNDVVVDDPLVSARHLRLSLDEAGELVAEDLASLNGVHLLGAGPARIQRAQIAPGARLRIGKTIVRPCGPATAIEPVVAPQAQRRRLLARPPIALATIVASVGYLIGFLFLRNYEMTPAVDSIRLATVVLAPLAVWALAWALVTRVTTQRWSFLAHVATICAFMVAAYSLNIASEYASFLTSFDRAVQRAHWAVYAVLLAWLLSAHLAFASPRPRRVRWLASAAVAIALCGTGAALAGWRDDPFTTETRYASYLKPVPSGWLRGEPLDDFVARIDDVKSEVDSLARR
jgi:hypothetical protein